MSLFNAKIIQVVPRTAGSYVKGRWIGEAAGTPHDIRGTWQPATETEIQRLPEGRRERSVFRLYTKSLLNSLSQTKNPDRVTVGGVTYELYAREKWGNGLIPHYKYLATEVV